MDVRPAGRIGDKPAIGLAQSLEALQFRMGRLKTGTPPRIIKDSIDFSSLVVQKGDTPPVPFSFLNEKVWLDADQQVKIEEDVVLVQQFKLLKKINYHRN